MFSKCFHKGLCLAATAIAAVLAAPAVHAHEVAVEMAEAADRFLKSLKEAQLAQVSIDFQAEKRTGWHYFPTSMMESRGGRRGLPIRDMSDQQRALAHGLLSTALSHRGYLQATTIMAKEATNAPRKTATPRGLPPCTTWAVTGSPLPSKRGAGASRGTIFR